MVEGFGREARRVVSVFEVVTEIPTEGNIRGLTGEAAEEADKAIADGAARAMPFTKENEALVGAIKRYLSAQGWGCKVRKNSKTGRIYWQVVEKKVVPPEQLAKMKAALESARKARDANKAASTSAPAASTGKQK